MTTRLSQMLFPRRTSTGRRTVACLPFLALLCLGAVLAFPSAGLADGSASGPDLATALQALDTAGIVQDSAAVSASSNADSAVVATADGSTTSIPVDPADGVSLSTAPSAGTDATGTSDPAAGGTSPTDQSSDPGISMSLPGAADAGNAEVIANGLVVYPDAAPQTDVAAQALTDSNGGPDGVRVLAIMGGPDAPTSIPFPLDLSDTSTIQPDGFGGYTIAGPDGAPIATVASPWATDADGTPLSTSYTLDGTTITMHVDTTGAVYPVVADPMVVVAGDGGYTPAFQVPNATRVPITEPINFSGSASGPFTLPTRYLAGVPWLMYSAQHESAVQRVVTDVYEHGANPSNIVIERLGMGIPGAGRNGGYGFTDVRYVGPSVQWVWEIKPAGNTDGVAQLQRYIAGLRSQGVNAQPGFFLGYNRLWFTDTPGTYVSVSSGTGAQAGMEYYTPYGFTPRVIPVVVPHTVPHQIAEGEYRVSGNDAKVIVGATAAGAATAATIWWLGKLASPICGPFAPACAILF